MSRHALDDLGQLQRDVMEIVWERGEATVHQVRAALDRKRQLAYTTILTTLQKLERAGWLDHRPEGKSYVYFPTHTRQQAGAGSVKRFVKRVFDGNAVAMFQHLIQEGDLSESDLNKLRKMIEEKRKEKRK
jgi:BlaI family transcriptional regulator, penicillinase repressor